MSSPTQALDQVTAAIRHLDQEFMKNAAAQDAVALVSGFYAPEAQLLSPHQDVVCGHEAIRTRFQALLDAGIKDVSLETTTVEVSGDMAYAAGEYRMTVPAPQGEVQDRGKYLVVYRLQADGQWRAVADMFNTSVPHA